MGNEAVAENESGDGHQLDENVDRWTTCILHGIADSITNYGILVRLRSLLVGLVGLLVQQVAFLNVLLGVVPSTTSVTEADGKLDARGDGTGDQTCDASSSEEESKDKRGENNQKTWRDHHLDRGVGRDLDASIVVRGLSTAEDLTILELLDDLLDHLLSGVSNSSHGLSGKVVREHCTVYQTCKLKRLEDVNNSNIGFSCESSEKCESD